MNAGPRVLVVLDGTGSDAATDRALAVHRALARLGAEVRSVALGPSGDGALDGEVPVLGPSPGSLASALQLRREARWADVVVCTGVRSARASRLRARRGATLVHLDGSLGAAESARSVLSAAAAPEVPGR